jgi:non-ribosomal peptide synthetase component F
VSGLAVAAAAAYLHRCTGEEDLVLGLSVLGRGRAEREVPGMTANVVPVRLRAGRGVTGEDLVRQVPGAVLAALRHQRYRGEDIARDVRVAQDGALFSVMVNVMPFDFGLRLGQCQVVPYCSFGWAVGDVRISVSGGAAGGVQVAVDVNADLYDEAAGREIGVGFRRVL